MCDGVIRFQRGCLTLGSSHLVPKHPVTGVAVIREKHFTDRLCAELEGADVVACRGIVDVDVDTVDQCVRTRRAHHGLRFLHSAHLQSPKLESHFALFSDDIFGLTLPIFH